MEQHELIEKIINYTLELQRENADLNKQLNAESDAQALLRDENAALKKRVEELSRKDPPENLTVASNIIVRLDREIKDLQTKLEQAEAELLEARKWIEIFADAAKSNGQTVDRLSVEKRQIEANAAAMRDAIERLSLADMIEWCIAQDREPPHESKGHYWVSYLDDFKAHALSTNVGKKLLDQVQAAKKSRRAI